MPNHIDSTAGNVGHANVGPRSIDGVEAGGTPQELGRDVGMRATPDAADAADHRGHGKSAGI